MDDNRVLRAEINYEKIYEYGDDLIREKIIDYDSFTESTLFKLEFPYIFGKEYENKENDIKFMMYDENDETLYVVDEEDNQFKYNVQDHVICKNDMVISVKSLYIPVKKKAFK